QAGKPLVAAADDLIAPVRQNEIDGGCNGLAIDAQQLVRRAVGRWLMGGHAKAIFDGLKLFGFLMDAASRAPPPRVMHERTVRWVHQPDDSVVHVTRQVRRQMRHPKSLADLGDL